MKPDLLYRPLDFFCKLIDYTSTTCANFGPALTDWVASRTNTSDPAQTNYVNQDGSPDATRKIFWNILKIQQQRTLMNPPIQIPIYRNDQLQFNNRFIPDKDLREIQDDYVGKPNEKNICIFIQMFLTCKHRKALCSPFHTPNVKSANECSSLKGSYGMKEIISQSLIRVCEAV
jgi:hypothetical protein